MLDCNNVVSKFELQAHYKIHIQTNTSEKGMSVLLPAPIYGLNSTTAVLLQGWFDMRLNKETKLYINQPIGLVGREFVNGPGNQGSIPSKVIPKTQKMVIDTS